MAYILKKKKKAMYACRDAFLTATPTLRGR